MPRYTCSRRKAGWGPSRKGESASGDVLADRTAENERAGRAAGGGVVQGTGTARDRDRAVEREFLGVPPGSKVKVPCRVMAFPIVFAALVVERMLTSYIVMGPTPNGPLVRLPVEAEPVELLIITKRLLAAMIVPPE